MCYSSGCKIDSCAQTTWTAAARLLFACTLIHVQFYNVCSFGKMWLPNSEVFIKMGVVGMGEEHV